METFPTQIATTNGEEDLQYKILSIYSIIHKHSRFLPGLLSSFVADNATGFQWVQSYDMNDLRVFC